MRRLASRSPRWLAAMVAALVLLAMVVLSMVNLPGSFAGVGDTSENLVRNLVTALVLAVLAYLWFYFWTSHRATRHLVRVARQSPERMFPYAPDIGSAAHVFGRDRLVADIAASLRQADGAGPQIVAGHSGTGKTTLLLALAAHLAEESYVVPIVLSLRDRDNDLEGSDFSELAIRRFRELIDPYIRTEAEADKLWRWMCGRGRIVVLADDLDRNPAAVDSDPYKTGIRLALDAARRRGLSLVLTTRPAGLPPDLREPVVDLSAWPLDDDEPSRDECPSAAYVLRRAGRANDDSRARSLVEANIEAGKLLENAYYLALLARLLRAGVLESPPAGGKHAVRTALLDADRKRLCGEGTLAPAECDRRADALREVEGLAAAWLSPKREPGFEPRWLEAIRTGERFGLLSLDEQGHPQFRHEVLHAYYASCAIAKGDESWVRALDEMPNSPRVQLALVLAAARRGDGAFCRRASDKLLDASQATTADQHLLRAAVAAEIARAGAFSECDREIIERCTEVRDDAGPVAKRAALDQIALLGGATAIEALWAYADDAEYDTRWRAVQWLVRRCSPAAAAEGEVMRAPTGAAAYDVLDPEIDTALKRAHSFLELPEEARPDDWEPPIVPLKKMAWMLPALRTGARDSIRSTLEERLRALLELEQKGVTPQRGLEASVAQGFKIDAMLHQEEPPDGYAREMLEERAVFWYSQLNLVHALALRMAYDSNARPRSLKRIVRTAKRRKDRSGLPRGHHPLLDAAAELCVGGLRGRAGEERARRMRRRVWNDEGVVVAARPAGLDRRAAQLVGEIVVLLNLNESGDARQRREFGEAVTVPYCLRKSRNRKELQNGCHERCGFWLCPFQPARDRISAHREISRAFCGDQRLHASRVTAFRLGSRVNRHSLRDFWSWLEGQARF